MTYPYPAGPTPRRKGGRTRSVAAGICLALAALLTVPAVLGLWSHRWLSDPDVYVATVAPLADDPAVQAVVADQVAEAVSARLDVGVVLNQALSGLVEGAVTALLRADSFHGVWEGANRKAHEALLAELEGREGAVSVAGDDVVLDVSALLEPVKQELADRGLGAAAAISVPAGELQVVLMDAGTLRVLRVFHRVVDPVGGWLVLAVAGLYAAAILLARNRPRMLLLAGVGLTVTAVLLAGLVAFGGVAFRASLSDGMFGPVAGAYYLTVTGALRTMWAVQLGVGVALSCIGALWWFLAGRARPA